MTNSTQHFKCPEHFKKKLSSGSTETSDNKATVEYYTNVHTVTIPNETDASGKLITD